MSKILATLYRALGLMPASLAPSVNVDILLTLLFWKLMSEHANNKVAQHQQAWLLHNEATRMLIEINCFVVTPDCSYDTCRWQQPTQAMPALFNGLRRWANAQPFPTLETILRPMRFSKLNPQFDIFLYSNVLAEVMILIGGIDFASYAPGLNMGEIFGKAHAMLSMEGAADKEQVRASQIEAQLLASLLQPLPIDSVYDPLFGDGQRLFACVEHIASRVPRHQLQLYGQEPDAKLFALCKMVLACQDLNLHRLEKSEPLQSPMFGAQRLQLLAANVVLLRLPHQAQDWDFANAAYENIKRFPAPPPEDGRLALIWHGLASMKPQVGRMGVILPLTALVGSDGLALRRYLINQKHLAAVIELPGIARQDEPNVLLLLREHHASNQVAFIGATRQGQPEYDLISIEHALAAARKNQAAPWLHLIDDASIAQQGYSFNLATYSS